MKKLTKKSVLGLLVAFAMVLSGCSVSVSTSNDSGADTAPAATTAPTTDTATEAETPEATAEVAATVDYPTKPITLIVPYAAGGTTDIYGRLLAAQMEKQLGQSITVTNQSGASGSIGAATVHEAASDGYTLLMSAETTGTYLTMGTSDLSYSDFTPIATVVGDPKVIVVAGNSPYNTLEELLEAIAENPGKMTMSHSGPGGSGHNQGLVLGELGYDVSMTSFESGSAALLGVIANQVDFTNPNISTLGSYIDSDEIKILAVFGSSRMEAYPDIPAFTEFVPEAEPYLSIPYTALSLQVNNDTPDEIVDILREAAQAAFQEEEWITFVEENAADKLYEMYQTPEEMEEFFSYWMSVVTWLQYDNGVAQISPEEFDIPRISD